MTFETLLIPTDGSDPAERAADRGFELADRLGASVHVLSVADSGLATGAGYSGDSPSIRAKIRTNADDRATALREAALDRGLKATAAVREGIPAKEIVEYADEQRIDAIAIGTSGRGGAARAVVGSVADKVVRTASVPVLTIAPNAADSDRAFDPILLPTDGSEAAAAAAAVGLGLAEGLDATVHLLSVVETDRSKLLSSLSSEDPSASETLFRNTTDTAESVADTARDRGLDVAISVEEGDPAGTIVEYVDAESIGLVAMGTAGRGGFGRALLGSVADEVVRTASAPVLTVRPGTESTADRGFGGNA